VIRGHYSESTVTSVPIVTTCYNNYLGTHCCNSVFQKLTLIPFLQKWHRVVRVAYFLGRNGTDKHERTHKMFFTLAGTRRTPKRCKLVAQKTSVLHIWHACRVLRSLLYTFLTSELDEAEWSPWYAQSQRTYRTVTHPVTDNDSVLDFSALQIQGRMTARSVALKPEVKGNCPSV
jgi:hypothetical protein